ncbi:MAG: hypothetical protein AAFQ94_29050, partial [Bacteroidota bacterium]
MKKYIHILLAIWLLLNAVPQSFGQEPRKVSKEKIEKLQQDSDFSYATNYRVEEDPLSRIWNWIVSKFFQLVGSAVQGGFWRVVFLILIGLIIAYAAVKLL